MFALQAKTLFVSLLFTALLPTFWCQPAHGQQARPPARQSPELPPERLYPLVFNHVLYLNAQTDDSREKPLKRFYSGRIGASSPEIDSLLAEAQAWRAETAPIDAQAKSIITTIHAATPGGHLAPGMAPPRVPDELIRLQSRKDETTLNHVQKLRASMGDSRLHSFEKSLKREVHLTISHGNHATDLANLRK